MKKLLTIILAVLMMFSIGTIATSCKDKDNVKQEQTMTPEEKIRSAVRSRAYYYKMMTIGGNSLARTVADITYVGSIGETSCTVSGVLHAIDVYGTGWRNNFDCVVTTSDNWETCKAGSFTFKSEYWSRS